jgi:hypothetical protein
MKAGRFLLPAKSIQVGGARTSHHFDGIAHANTPSTQFTLRASGTSSKLTFFLSRSLKASQPLRTVDHHARLRGLSRLLRRVL